MYNVKCVPHYVCWVAVSTSELVSPMYYTSMLLLCVNLLPFTGKNYRPLFLYLFIWRTNVTDILSYYIVQSFLFSIEFTSTTICTASVVDICSFPKGKVWLHFSRKSRKAHVLLYQLLLIFVVPSNWFEWRILINVRYIHLSNHSISTFCGIACMQKIRQWLAVIIKPFDTDCMQSDSAASSWDFTFKCRC